MTVYCIPDVDSGTPDWPEAVRLLRKRHRLCLLYRRCATPGDVEEIVSERWIPQVLPSVGVAAVLIADSGDLRQRDLRRVTQYALQARMEQRYPTLVFDYYPDNLSIGRCVSGGACSLGILPTAQ